MCPGCQSGFLTTKGKGGALAPPLQGTLVVPLPLVPRSPSADGLRGPPPQAGKAEPRSVDRELPRGGTTSSVPHVPLVISSVGRATAAWGTRISPFQRKRVPETLSLPKPFPSLWPSSEGPSSVNLGSQEGESGLTHAFSLPNQLGSVPPGGGSHSTVLCSALRRCIKGPIPACNLPPAGGRNCPG